MKGTKETRHPVIECFGAVAQGEGHFAGQLTHFIRFGGCDYRCDFCDSKYAVAPHEVKREAEMMTDIELLDRIDSLSGAPLWVVYSGGNPALQHLENLTDLLHEDGYKIMVETQGTVFRDWLRDVDHVTVSPKPPSSGNITDLETTHAFLYSLRPRLSTDPGMVRIVDSLVVGQVSLKIVVFDDEDYEYAKTILTDQNIKHLPCYLSVGTKTPEVSGDWTTPWDEVDTTESLLERYRWLLEKTASDPDMGHVSVLCQQHTLLYGHQRGV